MALASTVHWDIRTTGDDNNGGGFNSVATGTDYSQQDAAQVTYTDLVIGGTNTQLTSAAFPFTAAHVGNLINITGGSGFTTGRYQINSVAASTATMDRAVGTASSTGGAGKLGGGIATVWTATNTLASAGQTVWIKAGTYSVSTSINPLSVSHIGYQTTHGDEGTKPLLTTNGNGNVVIFFNASSRTASFRNIAFSHTAATRAECFYNNGSNNILTVVDCTFDGFTYDFAGNTGFRGNSWLRLEVFDSSSVNCATTSISTGGNAIIRNFYCRPNNGTCSCINFGVAGIQGVVENCVLVRGAQGILVAAAAFVRVINNILSFNQNGLRISDSAWYSPSQAVVMENNILYGNSQYGVATPVSSALPPVGGYSIRKNAFGANTTGNRQFFPVGIGDVTLTADPFTNSASHDYTLNNTAGGGAACRAVGYPDPFPGSSMANSVDLGALQAVAAGGGGAGASNYVSVG